MSAGLLVVNPLCGILMVVIVTGKQFPSHDNRAWEIFADYCVNGGLEKFQRELNALKGKHFVDSFTNLLEFHKLARTELKHEGDLVTTIKIVRGDTNTS